MFFFYVSCCADVPIDEEEGRQDQCDAIVINSPAASQGQSADPSGLPQAATVSQVPARSVAGGRFGVLEKVLGAEQDMRMVHLNRDQDRKEEEHALRLKIMTKEHKMKQRRHVLKMRKLRNENNLVLLKIAEMQK